MVAMRVGWAVLMIGCAASSVRTPIADVPSNHRSFEITGYTTVPDAYHRCDGTATLSSPSPQPVAPAEDHADCLQRRSAALARIRDTTDASERAQLAKAIPDCAAPQPQQNEPVMFDCDGQASSVPKSEVVSLNIEKPSRSGAITLGVVAGVAMLVLLTVVYAKTIRIGH